MFNKATKGNKNILVLGGAGFIGSHLCEVLVERGDNVVCVDNFVSSDVENIKSLLEYPNFEFVRHDVSEDIDLDSLPDLQKFRVEVYGFQEIYNFACPTSAREYTKLPVETAKANSLGVINSLELAQKYKAKYLLASTAAVYGQPPQDDSKVKEDYYGLLDFLGPRACYNEGKRFAETLVTTYRDFYHLDTKIARIFSTYGPRMLEHAGRRIPDYIQEAISQKEVVIAGAKDLSYSFCYVKDVVEGLLALMNSEIKEPVNLGAEQAYTLTSIVEKIIELTSSQAEIKYRENFEYINKPAIPDISKAKTELNWFPIVSLEDGLKHTIDYLQSRSRLYQPFFKQENQENQ
ncbi:GDP-mannose 4,6-dehydratase [Candidatus Nomurabacteria bacterium]|nr:GDP-mannose 4,6-dehydratase [Candidatus Nomurabacteria bacterium]